MTDDDLLSPEEEEICLCVSANRLNLAGFVKSFVQAIQLFDLLERGSGPPSVGVFGGIFIEYRIIAAKEGAMNIYHFGCTPDALRHQVGRCPRTRTIVDARKLKQAFILFNRHFPHANNTRHAVAHAGEIWTSPAKAREHRQKKAYVSTGGSIAAGAFLSAMLFERTYSVGWAGMVFEVQMGESTTQKLVDVLSLAHSAFP